MDAGKLKNVLIDLSDEEEEKINVLLGGFLSNISSGQSTEISKMLDNIRELFEESPVNNYSPSNLKILEKIGGTLYFGSFGFAYLSNILTKNSYNIPKTTSDLQKYKDDRSAFIVLARNCQENLELLDIETHYYEKDIYEVGLLFPKEVSDNKIINITKDLNAWDKIFKSIKELNGEPIEDTEIDFINNGSLEFFINNSPVIAGALAFCIKNIVSLYKNIIEIRIKKEELKALGINVTDQKNIEKQEKELLKNGIDNIAADLIKEFAAKNIDEGRVNELKIAIKGHVTYIAKCIDKGMIIEITPPELSNPVPAPENSTDDQKAKAKLRREEFNVRLQQVNIIQEAMQVIKSLGVTGGDIMKYLNEGEENKSE